MMIMFQWRVSLVLGLVLTVAAFVPPQAASPTMRFGKVKPTALWSNREEETTSQAVDTEKKSVVDEGVRTKLLAESIAPWRSLRLFLYAALGSGAFVGGLVTLSGLAAALSSKTTDVDLNTEYLNLGIDFGAAAFMGVLAKLDFDKGAELNENVEKKLTMKKEQKQVVKAMREREKKLSNLMLDIQVSTDGTKTQAPVKALQTGAKQHMIIVAGPRKACKDALIGANLLKSDFALKNVLVVPYQTDEDETQTQIRPSGGFGDRPAYETQPYVARPTGDGWDEYIKEEIDDAVQQNGEKVQEEGIAIVIANNGKVMRRGVGTVPWRQMVEQLEDEVRVEPKDEPLIDISFLGD